MLRSVFPYATTDRPSQASDERRRLQVSRSNLSVRLRHCYLRLAIIVDVAVLVCSAAPCHDGGLAAGPTWFHSGPCGLQMAMDGHE
jgi:hypothetical protein